MYIRYHTTVRHRTMRTCYFALHRPAGTAAALPPIASSACATLARASIASSPICTSHGACCCEKRSSTAGAPAATAAADLRLATSCASVALGCASIASSLPCVAPACAAHRATCCLASVDAAAATSCASSPSRVASACAVQQCGHAIGTDAYSMRAMQPACRGATCRVAGSYAAPCNSQVPRDCERRAASSWPAWPATCARWRRGVTCFGSRLKLYGVG